MNRTPWKLQKRSSGGSLSIDLESFHLPQPRDHRGKTTSNRDTPESLTEEPRSGPQRDQPQTGVSASRHRGRGRCSTSTRAKIAEAFKGQGASGQATSPGFVPLRTNSSRRRSCALHRAPWPPEADLISFQSSAIMSAPPATMSALRSRVAFKQIHITTTPTPRNLAESRLVLQALQKFGEVVTFRNLRYDTTNTSPNRDRACLAIFDTADAARRAIEASPLTIPVPPETTETKKPAPGKAFADPWAHVDAEAEKPLRVLTCQIQHSLHSHESAMLRNPYHSAYYVLTNSFQYHDLTKSTGIPLPELADCLMGRKRHVPLRIKRRIQAENERLGATSLMKLYEEGLENERIRNANAAAADTKLQQHAQQGAQNAAAQARNAVPPQGSTIEKDGITAGKNNDANTKADEKKFPRPLAPEDELEAMRERWGVKGLLAE